MPLRSSPPFLDRVDAGRQLAPLVEPLASSHPVVVALPRGGVPVAAQVAAALHAPLQLLVVRKLAAPDAPEMALGAIAEGGGSVLDRRLATAVGVGQEQLQEIVEREQAELERRAVAYRSGATALDVRGRTAIVVDDGMATGLTVMAAVRALDQRGAARVIVAVPVASGEAVALLRGAADEVVCHTVPPRLRSVGEWYRDFRQVSDGEVIDLLRADARHPTGHSVPEAVEIPAGSTTLQGQLSCPADPRGVVIFAHGSGSGRNSPRNATVASALQSAGFATVLVDLLTEQETRRREAAFDIPLLTRRMEHVTRWALAEPHTAGLPIGYFGGSTGAAAALRAAAVAGGAVKAIVSRGGRVDLAADRLMR